MTRFIWCDKFFPFFFYSSENGLEFLDLKLKIAEGKIRVDVYPKSTNSFSYTSPNTCYPKNKSVTYLKAKH